MKNCYNKHTFALRDQIVFFSGDVRLLPLQPGTLLLVGLQLLVDGVYPGHHVRQLAHIPELRLQLLDDASGVGHALLVVLLLRVLQVQGLPDVLYLEGRHTAGLTKETHQQHGFI